VAFAALQQKIDRLEARVADLDARLRQNSSNSSIPPSANPPHVKPAPPRTPTGRRKGGQSGHPKATERTRLPADVTIRLTPSHCRACHHALDGDDPQPLVHQVHEIPAIRPHVTEYHQHRRTCAKCGTVTCPPLPGDAVCGYGPRAQAVTAMLSGTFRLGKRPIGQLCRDVFGLEIGPATVCKLERKTAAALEPVADEALQYTRGQPLNVDETGWKEGPTDAYLWVAAAALVTVFLIRRHRNRAAFDDLIGHPPPVLTTDRYSVYDHLATRRRQVCWAHLRRDFQAMIDRANAGSEIGEELLCHADILFAHWQRVRDGTLQRESFRDYYEPLVRPEVQRLLARGAACGCAKTAATCRELLAVEPALWTFARVAGVEPTNNAAERALRHAVCWRKTSYGTDSATGSRFVERILTVVASCRQQKRDVLAFLTDAIQAARTGATPPSLIPQGV
jgi:transposase